MFEKDLAGNLYKVWRRMSSGDPVADGGHTQNPFASTLLRNGDSANRGGKYAQMVIKQMIEPDLDSLFLPDSYGYRPGKSALDAVGVTRQRCWKYDWVLEFDIKRAV
ncbi:hypothetical protein ABID26_007438 [Mesorhizobium shonense]|uniref:Reverse transcriptase domain-containing protein n=1 Tax=Mesorhizobium shonense TaxID=1209948 RepID=A0ABV2I539_9HYPH